jgi:fructokinase
LAAGPAIEKRWGKKAEELPPEHPAWDLEARYIAMALANTIYILSPKMIILGGGVMEGQFLFPRIRAEVKKIIAGYISHPMLSDNIDSFIVPPGLGSRSGIIGSAALAERAAEPWITAS